MPVNDDPGAILPVKRPPQPLTASTGDCGANPDAPVPYVFGHEIARGGMGSILRAEDCKLPRTVAVKIILSEIDAREEQKRRFINEAAVLARLAHPNIVPIYDIGRDSKGQLYYSMKLVKGRTLKAILKAIRDGDASTTKDYTLAQMLTIFRKVCDAMAFAHSRGIIHRDLKPDNIMVGEFGEVMVMDWGLAKAVNEGDDALATTLASSDTAGSPSRPANNTMGLTMEGSVVGTPHYMSPEQAEGRIADMDARSDIFSMGGILYCILMLRPPVEGKTLEEVLQKVISGRITPLTSHKKTTPLDSGQQDRQEHRPSAPVPPALAAVTMKALSVDKTRRYQNVAALSADVEAYQNGFATSAESAGAWRQLVLLMRRHQAVTALLFTMLLLSIGFVLKVLASERKATHSAEIATENEKRALDTLERLRGTAPTFHAQALALIEKLEFTDALTKIAYALDLAPEDASYYFLKGNILESLGRLAEAKDAYEQTLQRDPAHAFARENRDLCAQFLREEGGHTELSKAALHKLNLLMRKQGRTAEAIATLRGASRDRQMIHDTWRDALAKAGMRTDRDHFVLGDDGLFELHWGGLTLMGGRKLDDISSLRGMPLRLLYIDSTQVSDLSPLTGAPLEVLKIAGTPVADLTPLRGIKLTDLDVSGSKVMDLMPLKGMPLRILKVGRTRVEDITPLIGMPLVELDLGKSKAKDLSALRGMKLAKLNVDYLRLQRLDDLKGMPLVQLSAINNQISELTPLAGMPLDNLDLSDCYLVSDLRPLKGMPLTFLSLASTGSDLVKVSDLSPLQGMKLKRVYLGGTLVKDLSPLRGQPIEEANLNKTQITDFSVLTTWPLRVLRVGDSSFSDLQVLAGIQLEELEIYGTAVSDISLLSTMPLRILALHRTKVTDLHPLAEIPTLNVLTIPAGVPDIEFLRRLPNIQKLDYEIEDSIRSNIVRTAAEFWKAYDAKQAAGKK